MRREIPSGFTDEQLIEFANAVLHTYNGEDRQIGELIDKMIASALPFKVGDKVYALDFDASVPRIELCKVKGVSAYSREYLLLPTDGQEFWAREWALFKTEQELIEYYMDILAG